ncbi:MAG TPA: hypothetical protein VEG40_00460 [Gaiellaceae bacterium]|nr:hypothetical protein [Gaiellaceae bacterium]
MVVACIALAVALGGTGYAALKLPANSVGTKQLKKNAVSTKKIQRHAVTGAKIKLSSLGEVPEAASAEAATYADKAGDALTAGQATLANALAGGFASLLSEHPGPLPLTASFTNSGNDALLFEVSGSAYANNPGKLLAISVSIDGIPRGELRAYANEGSSHKTLPSTSFVVTRLASGTHTLRLDAIKTASLIDTNTDGNDFFSAWMADLPTGMALGQDASEPNDTEATATKNQPCGAFDGLPYFIGTISPGNDDWIFENCGGAGNARLTLVGGPLMDVYNRTTHALLASSVGTFSTTSGSFPFFDVRVHSSVSAAYTLLETKTDGSPLRVGRLSH